MSERKRFFSSDELAQVLTCLICSKIQRNSATISECLHSFCWNCIVKKIRDGLNRCPICHTHLGCNPVPKLRPDHDSRSLVRKLFSSYKNNTEKPDVSEGENNEIESEQVEEVEPEMPPTRVLAKTKERSVSSLIDTPETLPSVRRKPRPQGIVLRTPPSAINKKKPNSFEGKRKEGESISNCIIIDDDDVDYKPAPSPPVSVQPKKKPRGRPKKAVPASEGVGVSAQAVVDANARERRLNFIWLSLIATYREDAGPPLPQISPNYLRIKNIHSKVSLLKNYLVQKLNLESDDEVEIELRTIRLPDDMEMWQLMDLWGQLVASSEKISTTVGSSAKEFVMVISYSRKEWLS